MSNLLDSYNYDKKSGALIAKSSSGVSIRVLRKQISELNKSMIELKSRIEYLEEKLSEHKT